MMDVTMLPLKYIYTSAYGKIMALVFSLLLRDGQHSEAIYS